MTTTQVEAIIERTVKKAVSELKSAGFIKKESELIYKESSKRLTRYFQGDEDTELERVLVDLKRDFYFEIIPLFYGEELTIESIARHFNVDASTVTRNKKRLCIEIYEMLGDLKDG